MRTLAFTDRYRLVSRLRPLVGAMRTLRRRRAVAGPGPVATPHRGDEDLLRHRRRPPAPSVATPRRGDEDLHERLLRPLPRQVATPRRGEMRTRSSPPTTSPPCCDPS